VVLLGFLPLLKAYRRVLKPHEKRSPRSIWTGSPIITIKVKSAAEKTLGFDSRSIVRSSFFTTGGFDLEILKTSKGLRWVAFILVYAVFLWICATAERVHAFVDGGLLLSRKRLQFNPVELYFYRKLGIKLFVWTYGADVRIRKATQRLGEPNCCSDCTLVGIACICDDQLGSKNYKRVAETAQTVFSMGDMIEYTPGSRNDLFFWPIDFQTENGQRFRPQYPVFSATRPLRIVHAPNHRAFKGTQHLEAAVHFLQAEGVPIELVMVERIPNDQALDIYRTADIVFDQCLIGFHGYFAIEAMALGKPVMCFIRKPDEYLLEPEKCPIININRDNLCDVLRRYATVERSSLTEIGKKSRKYVESYFTIEAFANRLRKCYEDLGVAL
jgi:hypothetical protein